jgi:hypothetical protein
MTWVVLLIVLPNFLVRSVDAPLLRPVFFFLLEFFMVLGMAAGLVSVYWTYKENASSNLEKSRKNRIQTLIAMPIAIIIIAYFIFNILSISVGLYSHLFEAVPYQEASGEITQRGGLPGTFVIADALTINNSTQITLPYSNFPPIGGSYTFFLLPNTNIVVDYEPIDSQ